MDYDALNLFVHLSRTLHFARTSRECHISPSALSRTVQRLEQEVGWPLLDRDRRRVALTAAGTAFRDHAAETLQRWEQMRRRLSPSDDLSGELAIFASVTACQSFLPRLLSAFRSRYPRVHIRLETGYAADALGMLTRGRVDVAVPALPDRVPPSLVARVVVVTPLAFVAPASDCDVSQMVARQPIPWADMPMVLPASGLARASIDRWFRRQRVTPNVYSEVPGNEAILSLVSLGCGVGIVPQLVVDRSPLRGEVRILPATPALPPFRVGICTQRRKLRSPIVRALWDSIPAD